MQPDGLHVVQQKFENHSVSRIGMAVVLVATIVLVNGTGHSDAKQS
jgi:hypothetical protein